MPIRVLVVDDHQIIRDGLKSLFSQEPDIEVVGEASTGEEAIVKADQLLPDVVLMDITLPVMDGLEAAAKILQAHSEIRVIGLSMHADRYYIGMMKDAGASAYVLKETAYEVLADTVRRTVAGEKLFPE